MTAYQQFVRLPNNSQMGGVPAISQTNIRE
jgi:hypothetical protein